jgi:hypothetical protein
LLAGIVIQLADTGWRFAVLVLPLAFAGLTAAELRRSVETPDEPRGNVLADSAQGAAGVTSRRAARLTPGHLAS